MGLTSKRSGSGATSGALQPRQGPASVFFRSAHELVTVASHGQDVPRARGVALDVAAQARDEAVDHASARLGPQPPYVLEQLAARHGAALAIDQRAQEPHLA